MEKEPFCATDSGILSVRIIMPSGGDGLLTRRASIITTTKSLFQEYSIPRRTSERLLHKHTPQFVPSVTIQSSLEEQSASLSSSSWLIAPTSKLLEDSPSILNPLEDESSIQPVTTGLSPPNTRTLLPSDRKGQKRSASLSSDQLQSNLNASKDTKW